MSGLLELNIVICYLVFKWLLHGHMTSTSTRMLGVKKASILQGLLWWAERLDSVHPTLWILDK